jgi:hypothetical protein
MTDFGDSRDFAALTEMVSLITFLLIYFTVVVICSCFSSCTFLFLYV